MEVEERKIKVVSGNAVAEMPFNNSYEIQGDILRWKNSSLRNWLNDDFYDASFNKKEKELILTTIVPDTNELIVVNEPKATEWNKSEYSDFTSVNTNDKLFLLTWFEVEEDYNHFINKSNLINSWTSTTGVWEVNGNLNAGMIVVGEQARPILYNIVEPAEVCPVMWIGYED